MASIFTKIIRREINSEIVYENEKVIVIKDINPQDKTHLLIIPKEEISGVEVLSEENSEIIWEMFLVAKIVAEKLGVSGWYNLRINVWDYQEVPHLHMHLISKY